MLKENALLGLMLKRWRKFWSSVKEHRMHVWLREMQAWIWTILLSRRAEPKKTGSHEDGTELVRESLCFFGQMKYKCMLYLYVILCAFGSMSKKMKKYTVFKDVVGDQYLSFFATLLDCKVERKFNRVISFKGSRLEPSMTSEPCESNPSCYIELELSSKDDTEFRLLLKTATVLVDGMTEKFSKVPKELTNKLLGITMMTTSIVYKDEFVVVCLSHCSDKESKRFLGLYVQRFSWTEMEPAMKFFDKYSVSTGWDHDLVKDFQNVKELKEVYWGWLSAKHPEENFWDVLRDSLEDGNPTLCRICNKLILIDMGHTQSSSCTIAPSMAPT
jgi:hypothetical protein